MYCGICEVVFGSDFYFAVLQTGWTPHFSFQSESNFDIPLNDSVIGQPYRIAF